MFNLVLTDPDSVPKAVIAVSIEPDLTSIVFSLAFCVVLVVSKDPVLVFNASNLMLPDPDILSAICAEEETILAPNATICAEDDIAPSDELPDKYLLLN